MDPSIRGKHLLARNIKLAAREVRNHAPRFLRNQHARRGIPGVQVEFPKAVVASAGHIAQIQRRGSRAPNTVLKQEFAEIFAGRGLDPLPSPVEYASNLANPKPQS